MAGVQGSALAIAVSNAGGLGSLPCALLIADGDARGAGRDRGAQTTGPSTSTSSAIAPPVRTPSATPHGGRRSRPTTASSGSTSTRSRPAPARAPFNAEAADVLERVQARRSSAFISACRRAELLARVRAWGAKVLSSATTVDEARWLEAHGADAIIAQGLEAGGHRGMFLSDDLTDADGHAGAGAADRRAR